MTIFLVPNQNKPQAWRVAHEAAAILADDGVACLLEPAFSSIGQLPNVTYMPAEQAYKACDIVVTIGGDGTMLHTARETLHCQAPMLGINMGRLGFLTLIESDEMEKLRRLPRGEYHVEHRSLLQARGGGETPFSGIGLNDIVLFKSRPEKTIGLDIYCDDTKVSSFRGDGIVFATPTGSTAYSMSAGGPILDARLDGIIATHICAHMVYTPPMVFAGDRVLRAVPQAGEEEKILISCDGLESHALPDGEPLLITQSASRVPLVQFKDAGQLESIDKKLKGR